MQCFNLLLSVSGWEGRTWSIRWRTSTIGCRSRQRWLSKGLTKSTASEVLTTMEDMTSAQTDEAMPCFVLPPLPSTIDGRFCSKAFKIFQDALDLRGNFSRSCTLAPYCESCCLVFGCATLPVAATTKGPSERGDPPAEMRADLFEAQSLE